MFVQFDHGRDLHLGMLDPLLLVARYQYLSALLPLHSRSNVLQLCRPFVTLYVRDEAVPVVRGVYVTGPGSVLSRNWTTLPLAPTRGV